VPEINNSLALGITNNAPDIGKTLLTASQIKEMQTKSALEEATTAQTQQTTDYNAKQEAMPENNGLRVHEAGVQADTNIKRSDLRAREANEIFNDPSDKGIQSSFKRWETAGHPLDTLTQQSMLSMSPAERKARADQIRQGGMPSSTNMEATGEKTRNEGKYLLQDIPSNVPIISRTEAATGGRQPTGKPVRQITDTIVPNADGSLPSVPKQPQSFNDRAGDMFTPSVVRGPDGSISSSVTPATTALQAQATDRYKKAGENADNAQALTMSLDMMDHSAKVLNSAGWSSTGQGNDAKMSAAKSVNSLLTTFGLPPALDPTKIANWEDLNKETTRAGFKLASTLGSREAVSIVQSSVGAVPSSKNTEMGFNLVTNGIRQAVQRERIIIRSQPTMPNRIAETRSAPMWSLTSNSHLIFTPRRQLQIPSRPMQSS
jgi:hypothetical protein